MENLSKYGLWPKRERTQSIPHFSLWTSFPEIGPARAPEVEISKKQPDEFSGNPFVPHNGKLKFQKKFLDEFPRVCQ